MIPNELVSVIEGPVVADNYLWFKARRVATARPNEAWVAGERDLRGDGCGYFFVKDQSADFSVFRRSETKARKQSLRPCQHSTATRNYKRLKTLIIDTLIFTCDVLTSGRHFA